jgi:hypothetical protein
MTKQRRNPNVEHSYPGNPRNDMEQTSQPAKESRNQESKKILRGSAFFLDSPSQIRVPRLAKEAFGAFEEALAQRGILLTNEGGEFLQLSALLGVQACRHFHHHARK